MKLKVDGFREIERALTMLKASTGKGVLRRVGRKALEPVRTTMAQLAPRDTGGLAESIIIAGTQKGGIDEGRIPGVPNGTRQTQVRLFVGPASGFGHRGSLQEWGTFSNAAQPFARPAWDSGQAEVLNTIISEIGSEIERTAERAAKRAARRK